jgi:hypothetical protein
MAHQVVLTWTDSTDPVSGYNVLRGTTATGPFTVINSSPIAPTATSFTDVGPFSGLGPFYYTAQSIEGTTVGADSNITAAVFLPPLPPTNLQVSLVS